METLFNTPLIQSAKVGTEDKIVVSMEYTDTPIKK